MAKTGKILRFIYTYDDMYNEVYKRTSFLAKNRGTEALSHQLSTMSFTKDESFMFEPFIRDAAASIYEYLVPFSKGVKSAYRVFPKIKLFKEPAVPMKPTGKNRHPVPQGAYYETQDGKLYEALVDTYRGADVSDTAQFKAVDIDERTAVAFRLNVLDWQDENAFEMVDNAIFEAFINYIIAQWFLVVAPAEAELYAGKYKSSIINMRDRLNAESKPVRRKYHLF